MWCRARWLLAAAALVVPSEIARAQSSAPLPCALEPGPTRAVSSVSDGDSIRLDDGVEVRLLGILAPTPRDVGMEPGSGTWSPANEARDALVALVEGQGVSLAFAGRRNDRYGRVLAHLFVESHGQQVWVQGRLVAQGHARAQAPPRHAAPCHAALVALERQARATRLGLWSNAAYQVRPADRPSELARYRNSFQLIRGRVERTRRTRHLAILELASGETPPASEGRSQWGAIHVIWRRNATETLKLPELSTFDGRNVLVRGWIEQHSGYGPEVELTAAGQLEFEDEVR